MFDFLKRKPVERKTESVQPVVPEPVDASWTVTMTEPLEEPEQINPEPEIIEAPGAQVFSSPEFGSVRVVMQDNEPWFVAADVCKALEIGNTSQALSRLDSDEKGIISNDTPGGKQEMTTVSEPGLYSLVLSSRKPEAKAFKRWITHDVIPSIRKHGAYMTAQTIDSIIADPGNFMKLVSALNDERQNVQKLTEQNATLVINNNRLEWENDGLNQKIEQDAPKVAFADSFKNAEGSITINELAKLLNDRGYETGEKRLFEALRQEGYLIKDGKDRNLPTQRSNNMSVPIFTLKMSNYIGKDGTMHPTRTTYVTPAGQAYFFRHFCGENFRVSDPITPEEIAQKKENHRQAMENGRKQGWDTIQKRIEECAVVIQKVVEDHPGEKCWASVDEVKAVIPKANGLSNVNIGIAMGKAGVNRKTFWVSTPKKAGIRKYEMPAAIFTSQNLEQTPPPIDLTPAQEKKTNTTTLVGLVATIRNILNECEKKGMRRQLMTVEAFKWAHPEFKETSAAQLEMAMVSAGLRSEKQDGIRLYKVF